jgi:chorismate synthase
MANDDKKAVEIPKIPTLNFGAGRPSMFSRGGKFMPKNMSKGKFNQATFHTQHKGGTSGGK